MKTTIIIGLLVLTLIGCTSPQDRTVPTQAGPIKVETVARGLEHPWGLAFLPDGRMLVTERTGKHRIVQRTAPCRSRFPACQKCSPKDRGTARCCNRP